MGTNFYLKIPIHERDKKTLHKLIDCEEFESLVEFVNTLYKNHYIHIGKRSGGWQFLWDYHYGEYFQPNLKSITEFLNTGSIFDEYNNEFTTDQFFNEEIKNFLYKDEHHCDLKQYVEEHPEDCKYIRSVELEEFISEDGLRFSKHEDFS